MNPNKRFVRLIIAVSILIPLVVAILMVLPNDDTNNRYAFLPQFHALLNGLTAIALILGFYWIKNKQIDLHKKAMLGAFALSSIFLVSYVFYHFNTGHTPYEGEGGIRYVYFFILITHIILAIAIVPMVLLSIYRGLTNQVEAHKRIAKKTFPIWVYVTITGVLVYLFMRPYYG
jgi:putative membrane protein